MSYAVHGRPVLLMFYKFHIFQEIAAFSKSISLIFVMHCNKSQFLDHFHTSSFLIFTLVFLQNRHLLLCRLFQAQF